MEQGIKTKGLDTIQIGLVALLYLVHTVKDHTSTRQPLSNQEGPSPELYYVVILILNIQLNKYNKIHLHLSHPTVFC